jgi:hypothetical protein
VVSWNELAPDSVDHVTRYRGTDLELAPIEFGQTVRPGFEVKEYPPGGWEAGRIEHPDVFAVEVL